MMKTEKSKDLISRADAIEAVKNTILKRFNLADWYGEMLNCGVEIEGIINSLPSASVEVVRCKDCRWYDPPHIQYRDGTRKDVEENYPHVTVDVGINVGGRCVHHPGIKTYCLSHDRENPEDYEDIVIFRNPDDYCSCGERREP